MTLRKLRRNYNNFITTKFECLFVHIFIPEYSLALEYQGEVHFEAVPVYGSYRQKQAADKRKIIFSKGTYIGWKFIHVRFGSDTYTCTLLVG